LIRLDRAATFLANLNGLDRITPALARLESPMPADTPPPPYHAVIFTSIRNEQPDDGYGETADRMEELARTQPGFLGLESARGPDGLGITISYWASEEAVRAWGRNAEHLIAQRHGRDRWYQRFALRICLVQNARLFSRESSGEPS